MQADILSAEEIKKYLEENAYQNDIYITLHSLKRITKTGRITAAGAAIATVLNLKPILKIQGGKLDAYGRVRGMAAAEAKIRTLRASMQVYLRST